MDGHPVVQTRFRLICCRAYLPRVAIVRAQARVRSSQSSLDARLLALVFTNTQMLHRLSAFRIYAHK